MHGTVVAEQTSITDPHGSQIPLAPMLPPTVKGLYECGEHRIAAPAKDGDQAHTFVSPFRKSKYYRSSLSSKMHL